MKAYYALPILCAVVSCSNERRLETNDDIHIVDFMLSSEISQVLKHAVMVSREDRASDSSESTPCSSPSAQWLRQQVRDVSDEDISNFFDWHVYTLPFAYKLYVEPEEHHDQEYFGLDGEYTEEIYSMHEQTQDFWSESGVQDDIRVLCAHGSDLADRHNKLIPTLEVMFSKSYNDDYTVFDHANDIQDLITRLPGGYNYPLLTFNAFATDALDEGDSPSIMIGDGYFEFQQAVGLRSEGPEYALTHEHAHHLQFTIGVPEEEGSDSSQNMRKQELMADAFSAYFLAHDSGGQMEADELSNIHEIAFSVGDCELSNDGHHGTPEQRRCATRWGASMSQDAADLDLIELKERFDTWYERVDDLDDSCEPSASPASFLDSRLLHILQVLVCLYGSLSVFV